MLAERVHEWYREWELQGLHGKKKQSVAGMLLKLVELRFGEPDEKVKLCILAATSTQLINGCKKIAIVSSVDELLKSW